jgi:3-hydroxybutyryl-CoA dehydrogenase
MGSLQVLVIGSGVMGRGIAKGFAAAGIPTAIFSRNAAKVTGVDARVTVVDRLPQEAPELIIESVPEKMDLKLECYAAIEAAYAGGPVLASNTSALDLEALARPLKHPERFLGIHYFMPADVNTIVEVAPVRATAPAATDAAVRLLEAAGKSVVRLKRALPGLLINRLQHAILHEAYYLIEAGVASAADIDQAARRMLAPRMCLNGLIRQKDISGLNIHADAQRSIVPALFHNGIPNPMLQAMVARGETGLATGKGFYDWTGRDVKTERARASRELAALLDFLDELNRESEPEPPARNLPPR